MDPVILLSILTFAFVWGVAGGFAYAGLRASCPPGAKRVWFTGFCGPVAWGIGLVALWQSFRRRVLSAFGVANYSCCGGHSHAKCRTSHGERHPDWEPSVKGKSGGLKRNGYHSDQLLNQP